MRHGFALILLFGSGAAAAPEPTHLIKDRPVSYYPVVVGTRLVYDRGGEDEVRVISKVDVTDGAYTVVTDVHLEDGTKKPFHKMLVNAKGVFMTERGTSKYAEPWEMIRLPFKPGTQWSEYASRPEYGTRHAIREEKIKVPAGEFDCLRIETSDKTVHWYAAGIGVVKVDYGGSVMQLKSITLPKAKSP